jgi:lipopolysaccharide transport system ATP-binding protein
MTHSADIAIRVSGLSKHYQVYDKPQDRLKHAIVPRLRRVMPGLAPGREYGRSFRALDDISFEIRRGETVGIIGRNGSGKSTLLQIISGTLTPTAGTVEVNGRVAALLELGAGFNGEFTGRENVLLNGAVLGLTPAQIESRMDDILAFADIGEFVDQPVKTYSSGMYVRLAFAVIAHVDADILVVDEALSVGDVFFTQKCMRFLRGFIERGTLLFVSHDSAAVVNLCERAVWLERGRIRRLGDAKSVSEGYVQAAYEAQQGPSRLEGAEVPAAATQALAKDGIVKEWEGDFRPAVQADGEHANRLQLFSFDPAAHAFGDGGARVESVALRAADGQALRVAYGGERVDLAIRVEALKDLHGPIVGFFVKDRLGQALFGDNTYLTHQSAPLSVAAGAGFEAVFSFRLPILPAGDYAICVAVAEGTQQAHVQHQWIHEAVVFRSLSSHVTAGLVGLPMLDIRLQAAPRI